MAILGKFEVNVIVDGEEAPEYDDNVIVPLSKLGLSPTVSKYVEAVSGAFFGFRICIEKGYTIGSEDNLVAKVHVDGEQVLGRFIPLEKPKQSSKRQSSRRRLRSRIVKTISHVPSVDPDICNEEKMQFSDIQLCESEITDDPALVAKYCKLGTFRIDLWRVVQGGRVDRVSASREGVGPVISEKALKGRMLNVTTSFVSDPSTKLSETYSATYLDSAPIAAFNFKYQTKRNLQSLDVIPRTPSPVPLEERPAESLSRDEMLQLLQRQREELQLKRETGVKQEGMARSRVKREREPEATPWKETAQKFSKGLRGEKIYHLDSD